MRRRRRPRRQRPSGPSWRIENPSGVSIFFEKLIFDSFFDLFLYSSRKDPLQTCLRSGFGSLSCRTRSKGSVGGTAKKILRKTVLRIP